MDTRPRYNLEKEVKELLRTESDTPAPQKNAAGIRTSAADISSHSRNTHTHLSSFISTFVRIAATLFVLFMLFAFVRTIIAA